MRGIVEKNEIIGRLLGQHDALREAIRAFRAMASEAEASTEAVLANWRWTLARSLMLHLVEEEKYLYVPLMEDGRPDAAEAGRRFKDALYSQFGEFEQHMNAWPTARALAEWSAYSRIVLKLLLELENRLLKEECELYPYLKSQSEADTGHRESELSQWARSAWDIRKPIKGNGH